MVWTLLSPVPFSANSTASQLVKSGAHETRNCESTRLVYKKVSDRWKAASAEGDSISGPFTPEELATALNHLEPRKTPELDPIFPEFILHAGSALKPCLCDFFTSCMRQI